MKFKIDTPIPSNPIVTYTLPVISVGSCFADNMSDKLANARFNVLANPLGILYNPLSIGKAFLDFALEDVADSDLIHHNGLWHSWHHHGQMSTPNKPELVERVVHAKRQLKASLEEAKTTILITFGSAWVYSYQGQIVANCHKLPEASFAKKLLAVSEIVELWRTALAKYPEHDFIFTVSPVRYVKDGVHNSNLSKSVLHLAVNELIVSHKNAHYFPAYEIVLDELRDYRFYDRDLVHPNEVAIDYVWDLFKECFFDDKTKAMHEAWKKIQLMKQHRILHPETEEARLFAKSLQKKSTEFEALFF